jgi:benzoyl-CoA reductase/2-hydroxyglutaryl-CoA dehydratase subunit BcrC/BadD/HgdB
MNDSPRRIGLEEWEKRYRELRAAGLREPDYGGPLSRHLADGDLRVAKLAFDNSPAALRLWNFLLTEEDRLAQARAAGKKIIGVMKDLGTTALMSYCLPNTIAFYPDGAWWIPCVMEMSSDDLARADALGIDDSFCPVRAMLGAFLSEEHFPRPDLLICSVGATCDDFSAIASRLEALGFPITWWEMPHRRRPEAGEEVVALPGGFCAPREQVDFVQGQLGMVKAALEEAVGEKLSEELLRAGISRGNVIRRRLDSLRRLAYTADPCPLPALEMQIAEMLALHYCSDEQETGAVLEDLLAEVRARVEAGTGVLPTGAARIFWINPVADLRVMNLLEDCGGRVCGSDYLFCHALEEISEDLPPMEALARTVLADPMVGSAEARGEKILRELAAFRAEGAVISRIPGASHCALEGGIIKEMLQSRGGIPVLEIEVPPLTDALRPALQTRFEALVETIKERRKPCCAGE